MTTRRQVSPEEMRKRVAVFRETKPSSMPLIDAVMPQYQRDLFSMIGSGVAEDPGVRPPIPADGFHLSIVRAGPGRGSALHSHQTVEVFMPLTGRFSIRWGDEGEHEL